MATHRLKHSFSSGELSPLMAERVDFKRYKSGCTVLHNMTCTTQGPAIRRNGFRFIYNLNSLGLDVSDPLNDPPVRTIPFIFNELQAYALVFFIHTDGSPRMVIGNQTGLVVHPNPVNPFCPPVPYTSVYTGLGTSDVPLDIDVDTDVEVRHTSATSVETVLVLGVDYTIAINADPVVDTITVTGGPTSVDGTLDFYLKNAAAPGDVVIMTLPANFDIVNMDYAQSADELYIAQAGVKPHILKRYGHSCWELVELSFTAQPSDWSDAAGWPERVTFHQQRLVYAANLLKRQTVWMSKAGNFSDFGVSSPLVDSDAITFTLDSGTQNKIVWLISAKNLNIGTIGNEWTVSGATRNALTPTNVLAQRQTNNGSESNTPLMVGITTLFIERYGKAINEFVYDYTYDSYKTSDMTILSKHVTELYSIIDWTYQQTPDSVIWGVRSDGVLLGVTYQRQHEVIGWHVHDTIGKFKAITSIPGTAREDEVWVVIDRPSINGQNRQYYLEKMGEQFIGSNADSARFLDSFVEYVAPDTVSTINTLTGLDHLDGRTIDIIADGTVHPSQLVVGGAVQLNDAYLNVAGGIGFDSEVRPTLPEIKSDTGTSLGRMQRITKLDIDLYRSLGMFIGRVDDEDGEEEEEIPFRVPGDLTGNRVPLFTGVLHFDYMEGFNREAAYFIKQKQPLPLTVRAIIDTIEVQE